MSDTTVNSANRVQQWERKFLLEWVRDSGFSEFIGKSVNSPFQVNNKLTASPGDRVTISLVTRMKGSGKTGDNMLWGNEESIGNYGHQITIDQLRNAVRMGKHEQAKTHIDMLAAARPLLKDWRMSHFRDDIISKLRSPNVNGTTAYASTSEGTKDTWLAANDGTALRILFGVLKSNQSGTDHSTSLEAVDTSSDTLSRSLVSLMKRIMRSSDRFIKPIRVDDGGEWYILFCQSLAFRDLESDMASTLAESMARGKKNPLYRDGDLVWKGVIIREIPEMDVISGVGNSGADVAANIMVGAQALGICWGDRPHTETDEGDYKNRRGVASVETYGMAKLTYNSIMNGVGILYTAAAADA